MVLKLEQRENKVIEWIENTAHSHRNLQCIPIQFNIVNLEVFAIISFSRIALTDIFVTFSNHDYGVIYLYQ